MKSMLCLAFSVLVLAACAGPPGPAGDPGANGADGNPADRVVHVVTFEGGEDTTPGPVTGRELTFDKLEDDTAIRVTYVDTVDATRATADTAPCICFWQVLFNGESCADPGVIAAPLVANVQNLESVNVEGWCSGLPAGSTTLTVAASASSDSCLCKTGSITDITGFLEAEELTIAP